MMPEGDPELPDDGLPEDCDEDGGDGGDEGDEGDD